MNITKEMLLARKTEIEKQLEQHKANVVACTGALQFAEMMLETLNAPEVPVEAKSVPQDSQK